MTMIDLLIIALILVFIIDLSGIITEMEKALQKKLKRKVIIRKPFSCSLCMVFWTGLVYLLITGSFTIPMIGYVSLLSFSTPVMKDTLFVLRELILNILGKIEI